MNIFISQHYSRNKGNVSLLYTLVENIREKYPHSRIMVSSFDPEDTKQIFNYDTCEWPFITRNIVDSKGFTKILQGLYEVLSICTIVLCCLFVRVSLIQSQKLTGRLKLIKHLADSDIIISPGGHLFTNYNKFPVVFAHFLPCLLSWILRRPFIVQAQTIGPFFGFWKIPSQLITKFVLKKADYVFVRDNNSLEIISRMKVRIKNLKKTNEIVFLYPSNSISIKAKENEKRVIGFTFHHIYYKRWMSKEDYVSRMVSLVDLVNSYGNYEIRFISMEKESGEKSDKPLLNEIKSRIKNSNKVEIVCIPLKPEDLLKAFEDLDYLIATKTHSVVYGLRMQIPTLAIAYEKKTEDFMRDFNLYDYSTELSSFQAECAFNIFTKMINNEKTIKCQIEKKLNAVRNKSLENIDILNIYQKL